MYTLITALQPQTPIILSSLLITSAALRASEATLKIHQGSNQSHKLLSAVRRDDEETKSLHMQIDLKM